MYINSRTADWRAMLALIMSLCWQSPYPSPNTGTDESFRAHPLCCWVLAGSIPNPAPAVGRGMAASTPGTGGSQLLHFVFVFLEFSVHHFESSEEVPEEEQQKCESQNKNLPFFALLMPRQSKKRDCII